MIAPVKLQNPAALRVNEAKMVLCLSENLLLTRSHGEVGGIQMPSQALQTGLRAADIVWSNDQVQVIGLAQSNVSVEIEG
jgi:hypothetical protein